MSCAVVTTHIIKVYAQAYVSNVLYCTKCDPTYY